MQHETPLWYIYIRREVVFDISQICNDFNCEGRTSSGETLFFNCGRLRDSSKLIGLLQVYNYNNLDSSNALKSQTNASNGTFSWANGGVKAK